MLQYADNASLLTSLPTVEEVLDNHASEESFRRADWIDVTCGLRRFGLPRPFIAAVAATWPDAGFHRRLVELTIDRWWKHPLNPLPMVKW